MPDVVVRCARFVEERALTDGIYRVSGIASNIKRLRSRLVLSEDQVLTLGLIPYYFLGIIP